jgi:hypothetical protein
MLESGLDASSLGQGHVAGSCYMVMHLMLTKEREFDDQLSESCWIEFIIMIIMTSRKVCISLSHLEDYPTVFSVAQQSGW